MFVYPSRPMPTRTNPKTMLNSGTADPPRGAYSQSIGRPAGFHYATASARYREIACLVHGARATTVVVAAALPRDWPALAPELRHAVASFAT